MTPLRTGSRDDLPWLRRRQVATAAAAPPKIDTRHPGRAEAAPQPAKIDTTHPRRTSAPDPLDLSTPAVDTRHPGRPPAPDPLDLASRPADPLDLSSTPTPPPPPKHTPERPQRRARSGPPTLLDPANPTVTLTRLQSGVGVLQLELVTTVPALLLAAAYELADGRTSVLVDGGRTDAAPPDRPVIRLTRERYAGLRLDLRRTRDLRRLAVLALPQASVDWGGTLVVTTAAGARMEAPLDLGHGDGPAALLTAYVVDGELVLRAERELVDGSLRDACLAYGYDRITWADDHTPAD